MGVPFGCLVDGEAMTPRRERLMLYHKGSEPWALTPNAILTAAKQDLANKEYNAWLRAQRKDKKRYPLGSPQRKELGTARPYGFASEHVRAAKSAVDLLLEAMNDRAAVATSDVPETLALYANEDALKEAYALALREGT